MIVGIVDTTVIIHIYRKNQIALEWAATFTDSLGVTAITWLEVLVGAQGKAGQTASEAVLKRFTLVSPEPADFDWAIDTMRTYRLSHGIGILDCLIASVCQRLQVPLYTDNVKDFVPMLGSALVIKPY